jgi:hypothetical protein
MLELVSARVKVLWMTMLRFIEHQISETADDHAPKGGTQAQEAHTRSGRQKSNEDSASACASHISSAVPIELEKATTGIPWGPVSS